MADLSGKNPFDMGAFDMAGLASMGAAYQRKLLSNSVRRTQRLLSILRPPLLPAALRPTS